MKIKLNIDIISAYRIQNEFMHFCDVFEKGKQLGEHERLNLIITYKKNMKVENRTSKDYFNKLIIDLKNAFSKAGAKNIVFLNIISINNKTVDFLKPYILPDVQTISNGHQFVMFHQLLEQIGYEVKTNKYMAVTKVKYLNQSNKLIIEKNKQNKK